jgi:hypothetical protein
VPAQRGRYCQASRRRGLVRAHGWGPAYRHRARQGAPRVQLFLRQAHAPGTTGGPPPHARCGPHQGALLRRSLSPPHRTPPCAGCAAYPAGRAPCGASADAAGPAARPAAISPQPDPRHGRRPGTAGVRPVPRCFMQCRPLVRPLSRAGAGVGLCDTLPRPLAGGLRGGATRIPLRLRLELGPCPGGGAGCHRWRPLTLGTPSCTSCMPGRSGRPDARPRHRTAHCAWWPCAPEMSGCGASAGHSPRSSPTASPEVRLDDLTEVTRCPVLHLPPPRQAQALTLERGAPWPCLCVPTAVQAPACRGPTPPGGLQASRTGVHGAALAVPRPGSIGWRWALDPHPGAVGADPERSPAWPCGSSQEDGSGSEVHTAEMGGRS